MSDAMPPEEPYSIIPSPAKSEIEKFAMFFHQDWKLIYSDFHEGARMCIATLSADTKVVLKKELTEFLALYESPADLREAWLGLGAQAWQEGLDIRKGLRDFLEML